MDFSSITSKAAVYEQNQHHHPDQLQPPPHQQQQQQQQQILAQSMNRKPYDIDYRAMEVSVSEHQHYSNNEDMACYSELNQTSDARTNGNYKPNGDALKVSVVTESVYERPAHIHQSADPIQTFDSHSSSEAMACNQIQNNEAFTGSSECIPPPGPPLSSEMTFRELTSVFTAPLNHAQSTIAEYEKLDNFSHVNIPHVDQSVYDRRQLEAGYIPNQTVTSEASGLLPVNSRMETDTQFFDSVAHNNEQHHPNITDAHSNSLLSQDNSTEFAHVACSNAHVTPAAISANQLQMMPDLVKSETAVPRLRAKRAAPINPSMMRRSNRISQYAAESMKAEMSGSNSKHSTARSFQDLTKLRVGTNISGFQNPHSMVNHRQNASVAEQRSYEGQQMHDVCAISPRRYQPIRDTVAAASRQYFLRKFGSAPTYMSQTKQRTAHMQNSDVMFNQSDLMLNHGHGYCSVEKVLANPSATEVLLQEDMMLRRQSSHRQTAFHNYSRWRQAQKEDNAEFHTPLKQQSVAMRGSQHQQLSKHSLFQRLSNSTNNSKNGGIHQHGMNQTGLGSILSKEASEALDFSSLRPSHGGGRRQSALRQEEFKGISKPLNQRPKRSISKNNTYGMEMKTNTAMDVKLVPELPLYSSDSYKYLRTSSSPLVEHRFSSGFHSFTEPFDSTWKNVSLHLLQQPEKQHRARYLTEGSRGPIKNRTLDGFPTIQLSGWQGPALIQVFVANETTDPRLHMFYQVCLVSAKSNRGCSEAIYGYTTVVQIPFIPNSGERVMSIDSVGLVKLRNSDVEKRLAALALKRQEQFMVAAKVGSNFHSTSSTATGAIDKKEGDRETEGGSLHRSPSAESKLSESGKTHIGGDNDTAISRKSVKPKTCSARIVYRVLLLSSTASDKVEGVVQVISDFIRCTQIVGGPDISRMSICEASCVGNQALFIIGKNFVRGTRVVFRQMASSTNSNNPSLSSSSDPYFDDPSSSVLWQREAEIDNNLFYQTHLICRVPPYDGPSTPLMAPLHVYVCIETPTKTGRPAVFTYTPSSPVSTPEIVRISSRECSLLGNKDVFIIGTCLLNCRVIFRQISDTMQNSYSSFADNKVVWQREALIDSSTLKESHLIFHVPIYDGPSAPLLSPLQVELFVENSIGSSRAEPFTYLPGEKRWSSDGSQEFQQSESIAIDEWKHIQFFQKPVTPNTSLNDLY